jgi:hypothetical protein
VNGELLERQYRNHLSGYMSWNQLSHAEEWVLFEKNIGPYVGIDEVSLSQGELYTILINKEKRGRSGSIIAIIKGTDVRTVTSVLLKLSRRRRFQVREITLDMAPNMEQTARICFPAARRVTDRFHVQKLAYEAVQEMRVKARWEALDEESIQMAHARACGKIYHAPVFENVTIMTTERPITLQEYAMRFGTYMGLFWIFKFIFLPIGFSIPLLQLLFILMTLFVPVLGYIYARRYRNQYHEGNFSFTQAFSFCFLMYLFASILTALAHYVYFRFIDQGYLLNTYLDQLETIKDSVTGDMKISVEQLIGRRQLGSWQRMRLHPPDRLAGCNAC